MTPVLVLTTVGATFDPSTLAKYLVEQRLAACVNIVPQLRSIYRWREKIEDDREQLLLIKTTTDRLDQLRDALLQRHPYEVPELIVIEIDRIEVPYRDWLIDATTP